MVRLNSFQVTKETRVIKIYRHLGAPFPAVKRQTEQSGRKQRKKQDKKGSISAEPRCHPLGGRAENVSFPAVELKLETISERITELLGFRGPCRRYSKYH